MSKLSALQNLWSGRVDEEDAELSIRLHQQVQFAPLPDDVQQAPVIIGYAGGERGQEASAPASIRSALANLACSPDFEFFDAGDIDENADNDDAQPADSLPALAMEIAQQLQRNGRPFVLGGSNETAWASFLGCQSYLQANGDNKVVGLLNFSAHFNLRNPEPVAGSGTAFRQIHDWCEQEAVPFHYAAFGIDPSANTDAVFGYAFESHAMWVEDLDCHVAALPELKQQLRNWLTPLDYVHVTVSMDVFSAAYAHSLSESGTIGVDPVVVFKLLQFLVDEVENSGKKILLVEVTDLNPTSDLSQRGAKLAARFIHQMMM